MSSIYVTEPATNGKVILKTTVGEIEIELWSKEAPKACRNFVQLCMEGYYNDTAFHRLVRGFIVQGGDPTGTGEGGESIYGQPFKTEIHSRLSFNRRGLLGMACLEENMNGSQFFFTLGPAPELTGKHTLFGRVAGETLFNMLRLGEGEIGRNERPVRLHRIVGACIILNPYDDIEPRQLKKPSVKSSSEDEVKVTAKATKNFSLLSFGEEAEEEEEVVNTVVEKFRQKGKSAHDLLSDPRLSSVPVTVSDEDAEAVSRAKLELEKEVEERKRKREEARRQDDEAKNKRIEMLRQEAEELRRQIALSKQAEKNKQSKEKEEMERKAREAEEQRQQEEAALARWEAKRKGELDGDTKALQPLVDDLDTFSADFASYKAKSKKVKKGSEREAATLSLLERFGNRLRAVIASEESNNNDTCKLSDMDEWMKNRLVSEVPTPARKVLDPTMPHPDRYDLYDPRNPLNVRKRGGDAETVTERKSKRV
ncbi:unnamed protein product [Trichobilharzia szidati]|nr:unnamed protein product [Trichobilharzia szidati]